jgi:hypothetical protein
MTEHEHGHDHEWSYLSDDHNDHDIILGSVPVLEESSTARRNGWSELLRDVACRIRDAGEPLSHKEVRRSPRTRMPPDWWRKIGYPALEGARAADGSGSALRRDVWVFDPETAPTPGEFRETLRRIPDRKIGAGPADVERTARLRRQAAFGCFQVLRDSAESAPVGVPTERLISAGQARQNVRVAHRDPDAEHDPDADPAPVADVEEGVVNDPVFRDFILPELRTADGIHPPSFDADEAWTWVRSGEEADVPVAPRTASVAQSQTQAVSEAAVAAESEGGEN